MLQTLCPPKKRHSRAQAARWSLAFALSMSAFTLPVHAEEQVSTPLQSLELQARQWAAQQPSWHNRQVGIAPIDSRISVQACQQMLQFDQPFAGQPSVRVRCMVPSWQLFITLTDAANGSPATGNRPAAVAASQKVLVAREALQRGTLLSPAMFVVTQMPAPGMENQLVQDPRLVSNMELVRDLLPNTPLKTFDMKNAILVKRGQDVLVTAGSGTGFLITVKAEAQQDGGIGETIRLKNSESGRLLSAEITGPGTAKLN